MKFQLNVDMHAELIDRILEQSKVENLQPIPFVRKVLRRYLDENNTGKRILKVRLGNKKYGEYVRGLLDKENKNEKTTI
jgi:hypothetical protein